jgi:hypothetical protein
MYLENTCLYLLSQGIGVYDSRMHRMMRQQPPPPLPPPPILTAKPHLSTRQLNESIKPR